MGNVWFCLIAWMLAVYIVLDGFDLGAGVVHFLVARTELERQSIMQSIGPVWDGNEVWLVAAGGTLYFAFPALYAASFSGFYLALMMVLWLLILRGISIEFRNHVDSQIWKPFWDFVFSISSLLLAVFFGVALGNVVRGVPLDSQGRFFEPLWTNSRLGGGTAILDWYTILVGIAALAALSLHGALWVAWKTEGTVNQRAQSIASRLWWSVLISTILITLASFRVQPILALNFSVHAWGSVFPAIAIAGLLGSLWFVRKKNEIAAFLGSCAYLLGMLSSVAFSLHPYLLPASTGPLYGLTIQNTKAADYGLRIGLIWWLPGMALAVGYAVFVYRQFAGKVPLSDGAQKH